MKLFVTLFCQITLFLLSFCYAQDSADPAPEPEGEPEPELECYVCTGIESMDACAANQTSESTIETCAPGFHCAVSLEMGLK